MAASRTKTSVTTNGGMGYEAARRKTLRKVPAVHDSRPAHNRGLAGARTDAETGGGPHGAVHWSRATDVQAPRDSLPSSSAWRDAGTGDGLPGRSRQGRANH